MITLNGGAACCPTTSLQHRLSRYRRSSFFLDGFAGSWLKRAGRRCRRAWGHRLAWLCTSTSLVVHMKHTELLLLLTSASITSRVQLLLLRLLSHAIIYMCFSFALVLVNSISGGCSVKRILFESACRHSASCSWVNDGLDLLAQGRAILYLT